MKSLIIISAFILTTVSFSQNLINEHFGNDGKFSFGSARTMLRATSTSQPSYFYLGQSHANLNENSVNIYFSIPARQNVKISIIDVFGKEVSPVVNEVLAAGTYKTEFDASSLSAGVYFYRLQGENYFEIKKMTLVK